MIYRVLALLALRLKVNIKSESALLLLLKNFDIQFIIQNNETQIFYKRENITNDIRIPMVSDVASYISVFSSIRESLLYYQRKFYKYPGLIADGRDMGTMVFLNAKIKIYLDASLEKRAYRRMIQLQKNGFNVHFYQILSEIKKRDDRDRNRVHSPLKPATDALILDSTYMSSNHVINKILEYINKKLNTF